MKKIVNLFTLVVISLFFSFNSFAAKKPVNCSELTSNDLVKSHLKPIHELPLSKQQLQILKNHKIYSLKDKLKSYDQILFGFKNFTFDTRSLFSGMHAFGEWVQTMFLYKIISEILPNSNFISVASKQDMPQEVRHKVYFRIFDSAEFSRFKEMLAEDNYLDMPLIKSANGTAESIKVNELKNIIGMDSSARAVSLYLSLGLHKFSNRDAHFKPDFNDISTELKKNGYNVFFLNYTLSGGSNPLETLKTDFLKTFENFDQILLLSELKISQLNQIADKNILIVNDMKGVVAHLHALSELVFITGPVNLNESILTKTPTLVLNNEQTLGKYEKSVYNRLLDIALKSNKAVQIGNLNEVSAGLANLELLSAEEYIPPYAVSDMGKNQFERLLDQLYDSILSQLRLLN